MNHVFNHSHQFYQDQSSGKLAIKIKDVMSGVPDITKLFLNKFMGNLIALAIATCALWETNSKFAAALLVWTIIYLILAIIISYLQREVSADAAEIRSKTVGHMVDVLGNMFSVRLFNGKQIEMDALSKNYNNI